MAIKTYKPTTPSRRFITVLKREEVTGGKPEKSLMHDQRHSGGRNNQGKITCRHIGGGNRTKYRIIDFKRNKDDIPATVKSIQYDPNRSANIALIAYADGAKAYILAPLGLNVGDKVMSGAKADIKVGNALPLENIPVGTMVHNVEHEIVSLGKAGKARYLGQRPEVRGAVMNPVDHPHGGGEGKAPVGHAGPMTPWGKPALGYKTRKKKNATNKFILKRIN